jgi:hypothetical protein
MQYAPAPCHACMSDRWHIWLLPVLDLTTQSDMDGTGFMYVECAVPMSEDLELSCRHRCA